MGCCQKKKNEIKIDPKFEALNISKDELNKSNDNDNESNNIGEESDKALNIKVTYNDFKPLKVLGRGSFGEVLLVRLRASGKIYAMKILNKNVIKLKKQQSHTKTERDLMVRINCPFIVNIKSAFQDGENLYLVSEFMQGGDMYFHLHEGTSIRFTEESIRFYVIELVLALEFLHKNNMVYRDLKPENILLDSKGHIKITDFGLSKILEEKDEKAFTICGTPQYLAPEVLLRQGYDKTIDWWSLGCVMYEMFEGRIPFPIRRNTKMSMKIYENEIEFPKPINSEAKDFILKLLVVKPKERLGYGPDGSENVKNHPFFEGIDWDSAFEKEIKPPFVPKLKNDTDLKYFESQFTDEPITGPKVKNVRDREREPSNEYKGFTYMAESVSKELKNLANEGEDE